METAAHYPHLSLDLSTQPAESTFDVSGLSSNAVIHMALNILSARHNTGEILTNPKDTANYLRLKLSEYKNEVFCALFLNTRHKIIAFEQLFQGTVDGAAVYPRVVAQRAMQHNASAVIFAHNHPSGVSEPSSADTHITQQLVETLKLIDVRVLDHFVVANGGTTSFAERGFL